MDLCTLNAPEEVELSKKLIELHPWSKMTKFTRSGGEACNVAVRIARAYTKKDLILFCGYHGWHDWYLSANIAKKQNLDDQLLPGLKSSGVPRDLSNTSIPFKYNDRKGLDELIKKYKGKIAAIILEPVRNIEVDLKFLKYLRKISKLMKIVLIFDEITSGFHDNLGGIHMKYKIYPDMAVYGKALGNGTPISAILGKKQIMQHSQDSFISSTMWTDRIGFCAALSAINKMEKLNVQNNLVSNGNKIKAFWFKIALKYNLDIEVSGIDSVSFKFRTQFEKLLLFLHKKC